MSFFSSDRERRLWFWTIVTLVAIYSTLGPARIVADELRERNLLGISITLALCLIIAAVIAAWMKKRPGWPEVGVALGVAFAYLMVFARIDSWEERTHLVEYGVVAALIHIALLERSSNGRTVPFPAFLAIGLTAFLGLLDEAIQAVLPGRFFDFRDIFFNTVAGFMVIAARLAIAPQQRPGWRVWFLWLMAGAYGWGQGVYFGWYAGGEPKTLQAIPNEMLAGYVGLVVGMVLVGALQALVLRRHIDRSIRWVLASLGASVIAGAVIFGVGVVNPSLGWLGGVSVFGTVVGLLQWLVLRHHVSRAGWWVLASTVGWVAGMPFGDIVGPPGLGAVYGVVTGTVLVWLLRQEPPASA
ncbi:MAG: VanZ family protein [Rhodothermales bacterium]|nr:VanZ family protein [Rhodothermales bacterium]